LFSIHLASMPLEHSIYRGCIQNAIGPQIELFQSGSAEALAGFFIEGTEAFDKQAFQDIGKAFAELDIAHYLAQIGILEFMALYPIDLSVCLGEIEDHELRAGVFEHLFPRTIVGIAFIL